MTGMDRLLVVIPSPVFGGAEIQTLQVARGLHAMGAQVAVAAEAAVLKAAGEQLGGCTAWPAALLADETLPFAAAHRLQAQALRPVLAGFRPEAALVCCPLPTEAFGALQALGAAGVPALAVAHLVRHDWRLGASEQAALEALRNGWAAISAPTARRLEALFGLAPGRVAIIPNGLPPLAPLAADRARFSLPEGVPLLVQVGRLDTRKGAHLAPAIAARIAPARLILAGEGPLAASLAAAHGVHQLGRVADIPALLACADAFLLASNHEGGVPLVVLEAARAGCPILTTRAALEAWPHPDEIARLVRREPAHIASVFAEALRDRAGTARRIAAARAMTESWDEAAMLRRTAFLLAAEVGR